MSNRHGGYRAAAVKGRQWAWACLVAAVEVGPALLPQGPHHNTNISAQEGPAVPPASPPRRVPAPACNRRGENVCPSASPGDATRRHAQAGAGPRASVASQNHILRSTVRSMMLRGSCRRCVCGVCGARGRVKARRSRGGAVCLPASQVQSCPCIRRNAGRGQ